VAHGSAARPIAGPLLDRRSESDCQGPVLSDRRCQTAEGRWRQIAGWSQTAEARLRLRLLLSLPPAETGGTFKTVARARLQNFHAF